MRLFDQWQMQKSQKFYVEVTDIKNEYLRGDETRINQDFNPTFFLMLLGIHRGRKYMVSYDWDKSIIPVILSVSESKLKMMVME